ncbi:MAG: hypothetical protein KAS01_01340 [Candidatus Pacebacteria bacterium]|nr:hypothetical protein [Candidatus Paceibacterota bacterium]
MKSLINGKILFFIIFFSVFSFGQFSFNDINIIGVNVASACNGDGICGSGETIFNCKADCLPPGVPTVSVEDSLDGVTKWILGFGLVLSVIFLIWGGIYYIGSSGDAQKTETAKKIIKYAILGVFVIGVSFAIISVISKMFAP